MVVLPLLMKSASQPTLSNQESEYQQEVVSSAEGTHRVYISGFDPLSASKRSACKCGDTESSFNYILYSLYKI